MAKKIAAPIPDYWIIGSFTHKGITYNLGQALPPKLTEDEIDQYMAVGVIAKLDKEGRLVKKVAGKLINVDQYLNGPDASVLSKIRENRPNAETLRAIQVEAKRAGRSQVFLEALAMILGDA